MPMRRERYPVDWEERARALKEECGWKCEKCGKQCRRPGEKFDTHKRTLTVAHLDHDPGNAFARLRAYCAPCHLAYDGEHRRRRKKK